MSLYNRLFGVNIFADALLEILELTPGNIPRFRDCYLTEDAIVIFTRTGGGNRDFYESEKRCRDCYPEYFNSDEPPSGPWNDDLRAHPLYIRDEDDDFDATYAHFYFRFPEHLVATLERFLKENPSPTPRDNWDNFEKTFKAYSDKAEGKS